MNQQAPKNAPDYIVYSVQDRERGQKPIWTRLGVAFKHREGDGLNLSLLALPINFDGRLVIMPPKADQDDDALAA